MVKLFIPVGIPGCGKSTLSQIISHPACFVVSTDKIREKLVAAGELETVNDMRQNDRVFDTYHDEIELHLGNGHDAYADATNLHAFARERLRKIAALYNAQVHVFMFNNLQEGIARNIKRERTVGNDAMIKMLGQYEKALRDVPSEEYASVMFIDSMS